MTKRGPRRRDDYDHRLWRKVSQDGEGVAVAEPKSCYLDYLESKNLLPVIHCHSVRIILKLSRVLCSVTGSPCTDLPMIAFAQKEMLFVSQAELAVTDRKCSMSGKTTEAFAIAMRHHKTRDIHGLGCSSVCLAALLAWISVGVSSYSGRRAQKALAVSVASEAAVLAFNAVQTRILRENLSWIKAFDGWLLWIN